MATAMAFVGVIGGLCRRQPDRHSIMLPRGAFGPGHGQTC